MNVTINANIIKARVERILPSGEIVLTNVVLSIQNNEKALFNFPYNRQSGGTVTRPTEIIVPEFRINPADSADLPYAIRNDIKRMRGQK